MTIVNPVALPILVGFVTIGWWQNKRLDQVRKRFEKLFAVFFARWHNSSSSAHSRRMPSIEYS